jgi:uncharacterized protein (TIGR02145 family)
MRRFWIFILLLMCAFPLMAETQNDSCQTSLPFCGSDSYTFPAGVNSGTAQSGPNYNCLSTQPNPAWYYMQVGDPGDIIIYMYSTPERDIDFCCWGPFTTPTGACDGGLTGDKVVDCSYSGSATETCTINDAQTGEFYILLITNFSNQECDITFQQTNYGQPGAGTTNCNIVIECSIVSMMVNPSACMSPSNTFNLPGGLEFSNPPSTGTLTVTDITAIPPVSQTFTPPFVSPQLFNLTGIPCDGLTHEVVAGFSDSTACTLSIEYTAPGPNCPSATISGGGTICGYPSATATIYIDLTADPPWDFVYAINGVSQTPVTGYSGTSPYILSTNTPGTYTMVSVSNASCPGTVSGSANITVNPVPDVHLDPFSPVCLNDPSFSMTGGTPIGGTYLGPGISGGIFTPSDAGVGVHEIIYSYTNGFGCTDSDTTYLTVKPNPDLVATPLSLNICSNDTLKIFLASNLPDSSFSWTASNASPGISGYSDGNSDTIIQVLTNSGFNTGTLKYTILAESNGCFSDPTQLVVTVYPTPDLTNDPPHLQICNGQATGITLTSNVTGTSFTWTCTQASGNISGWSANPGPGTITLDQTLSMTSVDKDSVLYHLVPEANGCMAPDTTFTVVVNPVPELTVFPLQDSICSNQTTNIQLTATCQGTAFEWTSTQGTGSVTGNTDGTGDLIADPLINPANTPGSIIYHITPSTSSCTGLETDYIMWVKPLPHLTNQPKGDSICSGTSPGIPLTSDVTNTWFTWTASGSSGNISGYANQTTASTLLDQTLTNSGFDLESATYTMTPFAANCQGPDSNYIVTVYPAPDMANDPPETAICSGDATGVTLTSHVTGTLFTWTAVGSSTSVTGFSDQTIPTDLLDQTLSNSGYTIETVTYTITPNANECDGLDTNFVVTVYPVPDLSTSPLAKEICNNNATNISLTSNVLSTLFTWTCTASSGNVTGYSDNTTTPTDLINQNLINTGNDPETVTYSITPQANGCNGIPVDYVVTVIPSPYLTNNPLSKNQCDNISTALTLTSNVPGTQFTWTADGSSANITGYANSTIPGTLIDQTLVNNGIDNETVTYHITPQSSGCPGSVTDFTITVYPVPDVYFDPNGETVCEGVVSNILIESHVAGATFTWTATASSPNLSGYADGSGDLIAQVINNSGSTIETVTYQVTPEANGCAPGTTLSVVLTVNPRPVVTSTPNRQTICNGTATSFSLSGDVTGSSFAWRAFSDSPDITGYANGSGSLIAQTLSNNAYTIDSATYRIAGTANGCLGDSTDAQALIYPVADVYFVPDHDAVCSGFTTTLSLLSHVTGTSFTWTATGNSPDVSGYSNGSGDLIQQTLFNSGYLIPEVTYEVTPTANGCIGSSNQAVVQVNPLPVVSFNACFDTITTTEAQPIWLRGNTPFGGIFSGNGVYETSGASGGSIWYFNPALAGPGTHEIKYTYTNEFGCLDSAKLSIINFQFSIVNCGDSLLDIRDSTKYPTVEIDDQCWMASNLNYGTQIASAQPQRDNCIPEKFCFDDNPSRCASRGALYQWDEVMQYSTETATQGFCPPGWHIPTEADWNTLFANFISSGFAGNALKYNGYSGFDAFLTGIRFQNLIWKYPQTDPTLRSILFWSSTYHAPGKAWAHGLNEVTANFEYTPSVSYYPAFVSNAFAIRCIKD